MKHTTHKRNTKPATKAASKKAKIRREKVIEEIRRKVFENFCICGECKSGDYTSLCRSYRFIAEDLNHQKIPSLHGKVGTWQVTMVKNLFKDYQ